MSTIPPPPPELPPIPPEVLKPPPERANLLDSIRSAGGVGRYPLKSAKARKLAEPDFKAGPGGRGGGMDSLMGELKGNLRGRGRGRGGGRNIGAFGGGRGGMLALRGGLKPSGRGLRK